eukprot:CAMPEP_0198735782 /NCGR_PEP_ID=MMETSP1475-20131203/61729_1 /TAXON_ID= ORGANISM="Unidentified sp., Strain CCMP1999" /NCGR_SAMPLE_ID=MMETSP1475 /ASSEMBLY_ACC=CAM_ASM_001111 /LENGTH=522 /DNA_ID=CAMNT_0044499499 /DNA_START=173 /DNA_END=1742 /DNA_ORIENTATION=-
MEEVGATEEVGAAGSLEPGGKPTDDIRGAPAEHSLTKIRYLLLKGDKDSAWRTYRNTRDSDRWISAWQLAKLITLFAEFHSLDAAEKLFEDSLMRFQVHPGPVLSLLNVYAKKNLEQKMNHLDEMARTLNLGDRLELAKVQLRHSLLVGNVDRAESIVNSLDKADMECYMLLLRTYKASFPAAQRCWRDLPLKGFEPGSAEYATYIALLDGCEEVRVAEETFAAMEDLGVERRDDVLAAMVSMFGRLKDEAAVERMNTMAATIGQRDTQLFLSALVRALASCDNVEAVQSVENELSEVYYTDGETKLAIFDCHTRLGNLAEASEILESATAPPREKYIALLNAYVDHGDLHGANRIFARLRERDVRPPTEAYNAVLRGRLATGDRAYARKFVRHMDSSRVIPDEETYRVLMYAYQKQCNVTAVAESFGCMGDFKKAGSLAVFANALNYCSDSARTDSVEKHVQHQLDRGYITVETALNLGLSVFIRRSDHERVDRVLAEMRRRKVTPVPCLQWANLQRKNVD